MLRRVLTGERNSAEETILDGVVVKDLWLW